MRIIAVVALALLLASTVSAQLGQGTGWEFRLSNGIMVRFMAWVEGPSNGIDARQLFGTTTANDGTAIHRLFRDSADRPFFGYDLVIDKIDARRMRVTIRPLSTNPGTRFFAKAPEPKIIEDGDIVDLDIMVHPANGGKVMDRFAASVSGKSLDSLPIPSEPKDLTLESLQLMVANMRIVRNGETIHESPASSMSGNFLQIYVPGTGAIVLGLVPHPGYPFRKAAVIDNNVIRFKVGNDAYELKCSRPILQEGGHWKIWIYHDPGFQPSRGGAGDVEVIALGGSPSLPMPR